MALVAFFDENGHPKDPRVSFFVLAGIVASSDDWVEFDIAWRYMLTEERLPQIHTYDLATCRGAFADKKTWTTERRDALMRRCLGIITTFLKPRAYSAHVQVLPPAPRPSTDVVYFESYRRILDTMDDRLQPYPTERHVVFAQHPEVPDLLLRSHFHTWRQARPRFVGYLPGTPLHMPPLQAADIIAFMQGDRLAGKNGLENFFNETLHQEFESRLEQDPL
jgi:hypothetical protein